MKLKFYLVLIAFIAISYRDYAQKKESVDKKDTSVRKIKTLNFIAMGDWGRNGEFNQREVAAQMGIQAKLLKISFFMILGDNFYPSGVASTMDHRWIDSYENIYTAHSLQEEWWVVLGNHDYKGNPDAEVDYTKVDRRWKMPARYYSRKINLNGDPTQQVLFVFIDTTPLLSEYYKGDEHSNVKTQDSTAQLKWLVSVLSDPSPNIKWRIVAGHHHLYTGGNRMNTAETKEIHDRLKPIFDRYQVDAYICGHEHSLQYIKPKGYTHYFVSGAGSETTPVVLHPDGGKFAASKNGFIAFFLSPDALKFQFIDYLGKTLYKAEIRK
ncbi:MAG: metallophosphoesterase [Chitinophagales bacterium]